MGCARGACTSEKIFIFINIAFAMYSGALLATSARLMWDPSTYTWFRFLCATQYRVTTAYVFAAGLWLAALVYVAAAAAAPAEPPPHPRPVASAHGKRHSSISSLQAYMVGVLVLVGSEVAYSVWMAVTLVEWWRSSPQAVLARHGMDLLHDIKPALLAVERYKDVARPIYHMIEEVEHEAPNNVFVIIVFVLVATVLQVVALIMARRLSRRGQSQELSASEKNVAVSSAVPTCEEDSDSGEGSRLDPSPGWRKKANLRMYTILDKIF